jgi:hypothetical protein
VGRFAFIFPEAAHHHRIDHRHRLEPLHRRCSCLSPTTSFSPDANRSSQTAHMGTTRSIRGIKHTMNFELPNSKLRVNHPGPGLQQSPEAELYNC